MEVSVGVWQQQTCTSWQCSIVPAFERWTESISITPGNTTSVLRSYSLVWAWKTLSLTLIRGCWAGLVTLLACQTTDHQDSSSPAGFLMNVRVAVHPRPGELELTKFSNTLKSQQILKTGWNLLRTDRSGGNSLVVSLIPVKNEVACVCDLCWLCSCSQQTSPYTVVSCIAIMIPRFVSFMCFSHHSTETTYSFFDHWSFTFFSYQCLSPRDDTQSTRFRHMNGCWYTYATFMCCFRICCLLHWLATCVVLAVLLSHCTVFHLFETLGRVL